ncbi:hypothetical protein [Clavibacter zhangzhiyongii]|uniref:hypothetical protein n=1 Tax=Clavibacter zhangzhiyongii TaxID=2768071 RepID=UPI0039DF61D2
MTFSSARAIIDHLTERINNQSPSSLTAIAFHADLNPNWLDKFLARVAAPIGNVADIQYSSGVIVHPSGDQEQLRGGVVVITADVVVSATFDADAQELRTRGEVRVWRRSQIERVTVGPVTLPVGDEPGVRSMNGNASVTLTMPGEHEVQVPFGTEDALVWDAALLAFLPALLRA